MMSDFGSDENSENATFTPARLTRSSPEMTNLASTDTFSDRESDRDDGSSFDESDSDDGSSFDETIFRLSSDDKRRLDAIFAELKPYYMNAIQNAELYEKLFLDKRRERLDAFQENTILAYLFKKTFGREIRNHWKGIDMISYYLRDHGSMLLEREFLYFGVSPTLKNLELPDDFVFIEDKVFRMDYFIWRQEGDNETKNPPSDIDITQQNYDQHRNNHIQGWLKHQLLAFVNTNAIPELLTMTDLRIAFANKYYNRKMKIYSKSSLNLITILYVHYHTIFFNANMAQILKSYGSKNASDRNINSLRTQLDPYFNTLGLAEHELRVVKRAVGRMFDIYIMLIGLQRERMKYLNRKLRQHVTKITEQPETVRFRWQKLCRPTSLQRGFNLEELRDLAAFEGIPEYLFQTKVELCTELAQRFERVIQGKAKIIPRCINTASLMLTDLQDIPPEFFYSYTHNNKIYCDDIRDLYRHFQTRGAQHPYDRTPVSQVLVRNVNLWYNKLHVTTVTMDDLFTEPEPVLSVSSMLTSKAAEFVSQLNYPNNVNYFINADLNKMKAFVDELVEEEIMFPAEKERLSIITDATQYKLLLIDVLLLKFRNDPAQITLENGQVLSSLAINTSNIYNEIFYRDTQ